MVCSLPMGLRRRSEKLTHLVAHVVPLRTPVGQLLFPQIGQLVVLARWLYAALQDSGLLLSRTGRRLPLRAGPPYRPDRTWPTADLSWPICTPLYVWSGGSYWETRECNFHTNNIAIFGANTLSTCDRKSTLLAWRLGDIFLPAALAWWPFGRLPPLLGSDPSLRRKHLHPARRSRV